MSPTPNRPTIGPFLRRTQIAYFSMEIAIRPEIHTYSGGLGILAGDMARSCADLEIPAVFVTLLSRQGYLRQEIGPFGAQVEHPDPWPAADWAAPLRAKVAVVIEGREVWVRPWLHVLECELGHRVPIILLDTDLDENAPEDRRITDWLYGGDEAYRLKQEIVLGLGGARILPALGFQIRRYHLNEGHAALLALDLLRRHPRPPDQVRPGELMYDVGPVREACIFTTHTPVEAGHDQFPYELIERMLGDYISREQLQHVAGSERMNMTQLALRLSGYVNGVARRHAKTAASMFPGYRIRAVTNGVHPHTWTHPAFARVYDRHLPSWEYEPEILVRADQLADDDIRAAQQEARADLRALVAQVAGQALDPDVPVLGFARRMTAYKRPDLLFTDIERLAEIARRHPFQIVIAGKAHPKDGRGKQAIEAIHAHIRALADKVRIAFLPNYDMAVAKVLVAGADVWLNTPIPPLEASGTSGMKAALNGGLNLSVLDGWWVEACIEGVTGWAIGSDAPDAAHGSADELYAKLDSVVLPLYYGDRARWTWMMKAAISKIGSHFNTQRMMRRYASEAYLC